MVFKVLGGRREKWRVKRERKNLFWSGEEWRVKREKK
jgi:hypothetical protein